MANSKVKNKLTPSNRPTPRKDFEELLRGVKGIYSEDDLKIIEDVYKSLKSSGKQKSRKLRDIVPIEEWLESDYYLGAFAYDLFPYWKNVITDIVSRKGNQRINQVIFTGAIGTGKSTAAIVLMVRKIYELSCYEHISALFKLGNISRIAFAYLSVTREQAQNTGFAALQEMIDQIPYFSEHFPRKGNLDSALIWPQERLFVMHGSVANHFIGMNLIGSILDEANFHSGRASEETGIEANSKVARLYSQIINRAESRFIVDGINESLSILVSSSTNISSFTEQMINKHSNDPHTYIVAPALWDVKPSNYPSKKFFFAYTGGDGFEPFIINSLEDINILMMASKNSEVYGMSVEEAYQLLPDIVKSRIIKIPEEHRMSFTNDIVIALQDLAGFSSAATRKFFSNYSAYKKCINENLIHPFSKQEFKISTTKVSSQEGFLPISAYLLNGIDFVNKNMPRYMHVDLASTGDSIGISMGYISSWKTIQKYIEEKPEEKKTENLLGMTTMKKHDRYNLRGLYSTSYNKSEDEYTVEHKAPIITMDFMLRLNPPAKPERMPIGKIRDFILYLSYIGIKFGKITFDQWGSEQVRQELADLGYNVELLSVDRTTEPYYTLANLIYEERIQMYDYPVFREELFNVVEDRVRRKIDHTQDFHKDVADSVAGTVFNATHAEDKTDLQEDSLSQLYVDVSKKRANAIENVMKELTKELMSDAGGNKPIDQAAMNKKHNLW